MDLSKLFVITHYYSPLFRRARDEIVHENAWLPKFLIYSMDAMDKTRFSVD